MSWKWNTDLKWREYRTVGGQIWVSRGTMTQGTTGNLAVSSMNICAGNLRERQRKRDWPIYYTLSFFRREY